MRRVPDELIKLLKYLSLIVDQEIRKAYHVHEQDMGDFELNFLFNRGRHPVKLPKNRAIHKPPSADGRDQSRSREIATARNSIFPFPFNLYILWRRIVP